MRRLVVERVEGRNQLPSHSFLDHVSDFAFTVSRDGKQIVHANSRFCEFLGWSALELSLLDPWWSVLLTETSQRAFKNLFTKLDSPELPGQSVVLDARNSGGACVPLELNSIFLADDQILLMASTPLSLDSAEEILRQTQARFRSIVDSLSINLVLKGVDGRRIYANRSYLELRKFSLADILGKSDQDLFPADMAAIFAADDRRVIETGEVLHKFEENVSKDGNRTWTEIIKGPLRDADERITGVQILFWDATERKNTELALQRERHLLHTLLDNVPDSIYFKDRESRFLRISRGMAEKFKLADPQTAIGKTDADIFTDEHAHQAREDELEIMKTGKPMIARVERETWPDRPDSWCSTTKLPLYDPDGRVVGTFGISRDVTDLMQAEQQLREARDVADRANMAKSEFLANMSHEIRTPMNGIIGMTELLSHTKLADDQRSFVEMIEQSAQSLLRIINDILDFSKIEAGKLELELRPFGLRRCVSHAAKSLAARAAQKSIELVLEMEPDVPDHLIGDPDRLRQVLVNLVGNAIKFTSKGEITIRVAVAHGPPTTSDYTLHFSVRDTGIGIPRHKQESIFDAFSQADVSTTRQYGGTGLGLSISSQLVQMMDGRIWLESEPGIGSTFHFTATFAEDRKHRDSDDDDDPTDSLRGMRVLLVDDNSSSREALRESLSRRGLHVHAVATAAEAIAHHEKLRQHASESCALLVDQTLPDMDGIALIEQLHHDHPEFHPRVIVLTAMARGLPPDFSTRHQLAAVLQKPALQSEILHALRKPLQSESLAEEQDESQTSQPAARGLRFLLAEDGVVNRAVFMGLLEREGHMVTAVEDGQEAIEAWRDFDYDAILMDVQMPRLDGLQATTLIRKEEAASGGHVPIIAITAAAMQGDQEKCQAAGMDDYLSKPVDVKQLQRVIQDIRSGSVGASSKPAGGIAAPGTDQNSAPLPEKGTLSQESTINFAAPLAKLNYTEQQQLQLVSTLQKETNQRLEELTRAIDGHDAKLLIRASHSLKSAAALFEAQEVVDAAGTVEDLARRGDLATASQHFADLRQTARSMLNDINAWLENH